MEEIKGKSTFAEVSHAGSQQSFINGSSQRPIDEAAIQMKINLLIQKLHELKTAQEALDKKLNSNLEVQAEIAQLMEILNKKEFSNHVIIPPSKMEDIVLKIEKDDISVKMIESGFWKKAAVVGFILWITLLSVEILIIFNFLGVRV